MEKKFSCILIEDELPAAQILELYISRIDFLDLSGTFNNATKALKFLSQSQTDLLFLDINLPIISGINLLKSIHSSPQVIITTAYPEYAVEGFELEVLDFLIKPISFERFLKSINRFLKTKEIPENPVHTEIKEKEKGFIFIKSERKMVKVFFDDIYYLEAQGNYTLVITHLETIKTYHSISEIGEKLPEHDFARVHRSFIVAISKIESYTKDFLEIRNIQIPVGRMYAHPIQEILKNRTPFN